MVINFKKKLNENFKDQHLTETRMNKPSLEKKTMENNF